MIDINKLHVSDTILGLDLLNNLPTKIHIIKHNT